MAKLDRYDTYVHDNLLGFNYQVHNEGCKVGSERWKPSRFHKYLCREVQSFLEEETGNAYDILLIMAPPQHGKSEAVTETLPAWYLGNHPDRKVIVGCYNSEYARKFGLANRSHIKNYGWMYDVKLSPSSRSVDGFLLDNNIGRFICRGMLAGITGNAADLIIIDDPIKNDTEAQSKTTRDKIWSEYQRSVKTRLAAGGKVIVIMTPWHEDDLAGRILKTERHLRVLRFPCESEGEGDLLGRPQGAALCPEIGKDDKWLADFKDSFLRGDEMVDGMAGTRAWESMFQCRPTSEEGNILKREWWQWYTILPKMEKLIMSVDCAFKGADNSDYVAIEVWGKRGADFYLIDIIKDHLDFPQTVSAIYGVKSQYPGIREVLIEDKANGPAVMQVLRHKVTGLIPVQPRGGKESRVNSVSFAVESGNVYLPKGRAFANEFVEECAAFPSGAHDDMVDAFTQALARLLFVKSPQSKEQIDRYRYLPKPKRHHGYRGRGEEIVIV